MADNREVSDRPIHEVAKLDQVRNVAGSALLRTIPANQPTRFMMATPVQSSTAIISTTSTIQAQVLPKVTVQGSTPTQINRISAAVPIQVSSTAAGYHVPRGAAAVANIAVPRSSVATPIVRGPATLQTIGVAAAPTHPMSGGTVPASAPIVGRSVVGVTPWVTSSIAQQVSARQTPSPAQHQTRAPLSSSQQQIQVNAASSRMVSGQMRPVGDSQQTRPVLLHTTTHKQITLTQQAQLQSFVEGTQTNTGEKAVAVKSYGASSCNQGNRGSTAAPASSISRLATTLPPAVVSLQPAVIVPTTQAFPVKGSTTTQAKVITQQTHGTTMQISTVAMSSVQPAIAINTVVSRPGVVAVMLTSQATTSGTTVPPTVTMRGMTPQQHVKVYSSNQANSNTSTNSVNSSSTNTMGSISGDAVTVSAPTPVYIHASQHKTAPSQPTAPASAILVRPPHSQVKEPAEHQGLMPGSQGVRINSLMVVDPARVQVHPFVSSEGVAVVAESGVAPSPMGTISLSGSLSHSLISKQNTSPRPSILRKRDPPEGSPLKAQKNLTPVLASMASSSTLSSNYSVSPPPNTCGPLVAPGSPRLPEHAGVGGSGQSSSSSTGTGSTTLSANSSPGESPTIKLESQEDQDTPAIIPTSQPTTVTTPHQHQEMSPRKKPRKQQLTGNQITEPAFSEDEMEFISEDKVKIEPKPEENEEKCLPKKTMSLLNGYRHPWKSRNNHFLRYSDIRPKEERKPTLSELANQKHALQKLNGWKIYHLNSQMEDMVNSETEFFGLYTSLLSSLEIKQKKCKNKDLDREIGRVSERIRANFQRSKVLKDQIQEAKLQVMKLFEHKGYVADIINRNVTKRPAKKRERV
ncbi:hypothetical protein O3M35_005153 [Rhynocoris fuscipes]|uniref:Histone deacetylase complex subunit SAP130 C-terminal domain-containing protein n=1 Tax=Rhynocoris fuscipes TaxID=488301 RepID=A0AAW1DH88_9HEMI